MNQETRISFFVLLLSFFGINFAAGGIQDSNFLFAQWIPNVCRPEDREDLLINIEWDLKSQKFKGPFMIIEKIKSLKVVIRGSWRYFSHDPSSMVFKTESDLEILMPKSGECLGYLRIKVSKGWNGQTPTLILVHRPFPCSNKNCDSRYYSDFDRLQGPIWRPYECGYVSRPTMRPNQGLTPFPYIGDTQKCKYSTPFEHMNGIHSLGLIPLASLTNIKFKYNNDVYEIIRNGKKQWNYLSELQTALQSGNLSIGILGTKDDLENKMYISSNCTNGYRCINWLDSFRCECQVINETLFNGYKVVSYVPVGLNFPLINHIGINTEKGVNCTFGEKNIFNKDLSCICYSSSYAGPHCDINCSHYCKSNRCYMEHDEVQCLTHTDDDFFVKGDSSPEEPAKSPKMLILFIYACVVSIIDLFLIPLCVVFAIRWKRRLGSKSRGFRYTINTTYRTEEGMISNQNPIPQSSAKPSFPNAKHNNNNIGVVTELYTDPLQDDTYVDFTNEYEYPTNQEFKKIGKSFYNDVEIKEDSTKKRHEASVPKEENHENDYEGYYEVGVFQGSDIKEKELKK